MSLHLYDTATRAVRPFVPVKAGRVGMYLCGATVQAPPHVGHVRSGLVFDVLTRWLQFTGDRVTFIRNVTDIDDKIIARAGENGEPYWALAMRNERAFTRAYTALGCLPPTYEPRATGHVPQMIALMAELERRGYAYASAGDVYFNVRAFASYGSLSGRRIDELEPAADSDPRGKRDARDFALWKGVKPGEPAWDTPWGAGRPGWHLECSAMAAEYLGTEFDIHGGGLDLIFPHHENEIAQSVAAGGIFARYWMHNAWVTTAGEKMSKSLGNSLLVDSVVARTRPIELRWYLVGAHYRSMLEYSEAGLAEAGVGFGRIESFLLRAREAAGNTDPSTGELPAGFAAALDDDLSVPAALAVLHDTVHIGNRLLAATNGQDLGLIADCGASVRRMLAVLGIDPLDPAWSLGPSTGDNDELLGELLDDVLEQRQKARKDKDFATADAIRDRLAALGVALEDTPQGPRWTITGTTEA